jgi:hypothetical protein
MSTLPLEEVAQKLGYKKKFAFIDQFGHCGYEFGRFDELHGKYGLFVRSVEAYHDHTAAWFYHTDDNQRLKMMAYCLQGTGDRNRAIDLENVQLSDLPKLLDLWFYKQAIEVLDPTDGKTKYSEGPETLNELVAAWIKHQAEEEEPLEEGQEAIKVDLVPYRPDDGIVQPPSGFEERITWVHP